MKALELEHLLRTYNKVIKCLIFSPLRDRRFQLENLLASHFQFEGFPVLLKVSDANSSLSR